MLSVMFPRCLLDWLAISACAKLGSQQLYEFRNKWALKALQILGIKDEKTCILPHPPFATTGLQMKNIYPFLLQSVIWVPGSCWPKKHCTSQVQRPLVEEWVLMNTEHFIQSRTATSLMCTCIGYEWLSGEMDLSSLPGNCPNIRITETCENFCSPLDLPGYASAVWDCSWSKKRDYAISAQECELSPFLRQCLHPFHSCLPVVFFKKYWAVIYVLEALAQDKHSVKYTVLAYWFYRSAGTPGR